MFNLAFLHSGLRVLESSQPPANIPAEATAHRHHDSMLVIDSNWKFGRLSEEASILVPTFPEFIVVSSTYTYRLLVHHVPTSCQTVETLIAAFPC
jgi:hypothetical protein